MQIRLVSLLSMSIIERFCGFTPASPCGVKELKNASNYVLRELLLLTLLVLYLPEFAEALGLSGSGSR